jgi:arginine/ornithine N-succinyltransferase beta subunit
MLVANRSMEQFRALLVAKEQVQTETIALSEEQASALYAEAGTDLWMIPLRY